MTAFCGNHRTAPSSIAALLLAGVISGALWGCDMYALVNSAKDPDAWQGASASFVLNEAKRLVPWAIANDSAVAAASRESGQGSFFEISSSIPLYWIAKGQVEQVRSDDLFVIYQNGTPIAWLFVPSEEERAKTNTDGNYSRVASLGIHDSACSEIRGAYAVVRMSESCRIRFNELERELADSEWILDSEGQWFLN